MHLGYVTNSLKVLHFMGQDLMKEACKVIHYFENNPIAELPSEGEMEKLIRQDKAVSFYIRGTLDDLLLKNGILNSLPTNEEDIMNHSDMSTCIYDLHIIDNKYVIYECTNIFYDFSDDSDFDYEENLNCGKSVDYILLNGKVVSMQSIDDISPQTPWHIQLLRSQVPMRI